ncbi:MAG: glycosyltransferase family 4 protein [Pseudomonadota bacterium]
MKVLMLADVFFPDTTGGAGRVAYHLSGELCRKGHEVHVVTRNPDGNLPSLEMMEENLHIHRFSVPPDESLGFILSEIRNSYHLCRQLREKAAFDLACVHQSLAAVGPWLSGIMKGVPVIYFYHSPWHEEFLIKNPANAGKTSLRTLCIASIMKRVERRTLLRADKTVALSQYMRRKVINHHHYPEKRVNTIPGGIELDRFRLPDRGKDAVKAQTGMPHDRTVFLTVRNLVPRMGLENLVKAFHRSELLRKEGLLFIGGRGPLSDQLKKQISDFHLADSVRLLGHIPDEDLPKFYQAADFFVLPTQELEGFGLVILEALASGTPVLGTPVGAIPEVLGAFDQRLLFKGTGWRTIQEKMEEVIRTPEKYHHDASSCRAFVENTYSWEKLADQFLEEMSDATSS